MGFYDKRIKKLCEDCPRLLIKAVNSIFGKHHDENTEIIYLDKEQIVDVDDSESFMDLLIKIENSIYHWEFQLMPGNMAIRMYEYSVKETLRSVRQKSNLKKEGKTEYELIVKMPEQVVVFLAGGNESNQIKITLILPNGKKTSYITPCVSASDNVDSLITRELFLLIPFQQVQLYKRMNKIKTKSNEEKLKLARDIFSYHVEVKNRLEMLSHNAILTVDEGEKLWNIFIDIEEYIAEKDRTVSSEVSSMGDKDYISFSERAEMRGIEKGIEKGLVTLIVKKLQKGYKPEEIAEMLETDVEKVNAINIVADRYADDYNIDKIVEDVLAGNS